ncbi:uncharacterized protein LOC127158010 [Labeo rohita]|uniref:uncharacterized protein LOC127158010 n=1 Tax=Labeo rohita TaxID=84645 RepID=UPI0021E287E5|nr:uncharacterized protein LOC127158010 [Labeo rohita]
MKNTVLLSVFLVFWDGVFGAAAERKQVSVLEGDSVTLYTNITETRKIDLMMWMYGSQGSIIAKLNGKTQVISLYDVDDGRFGDRLQLDNQTGSLRISDIRTKHSGDYQLKIISSETSYKTFSLTVHDVFFAGLTNMKEGKSVTLQTGVSELQKYDVILWMFGPLSPDTLLAEINITLHKISYTEDVRLRDRLQLDDQTGSLTITDTRSTDTGVYQLQITNSEETSYKRYNVYVTVPEPGLSSGGLAALIVFCLLLFAAVIGGVFYYRRKYSRLKHEMTEGDSVPLHTGIAEPQQYDQILWRFGPQGSHIAKIPLRNKETLPEDDERFTIDLLYVDSLQFSEGEDVTLDTGVSELQRDDQILWSFGSEDNIIAIRDGDTNEIQMMLMMGDSETDCRWMIGLDL